MSENKTPPGSGAENILLPRRRPAQQRSRERFSKILITARQVLVDVGVESFTFDEVAKRAELPIGTLYQYFANKYALICELDREDTAATLEQVHRFAEQVPGLQWPDFLDELIEHLAQMWHADPSRRAVWHAVQSTPATRDTAAATQRPLLDILAQVLTPLSPGMSDAMREEMARLLIHTVIPLLNYAVHNATDDESFNRIISEIKRMIVAYLFAVATS
ncbi:TetR/AcrR family transcriptional regulator [Corynebacterium sp. sy017]|uniref:TetR/AcrR family transcriptional regulator n=1 Tax=unclassified Corynebacterium TaxID=2624378 RepID=UPI00118716F2|nr:MULTISPECIES: TetR/AcrR family transcriptional regulator [unclassified Corynebacterium]MBP3088160.1 TetR/AcrR family transcriptional regulator [Corynebacterium sp. sy017]QDZ43096.1 TetR/AcrR family transcriptional regulator [Corynebacterium sp. sy039]TSD92670.1 TetR/AcrR family transcriptional regulator [Corynebacterium sp. SY003]